MRPSARAEVAMMVRAVAGYDADYTFERLSIVESLHYQMLWWLSKKAWPVKPGGARRVDVVL